MPYVREAIGKPYAIDAEILKNLDLEILLSESLLFLDLKK